MNAQVQPNNQAVVTVVPQSAGGPVYTGGCQWQVSDPSITLDADVTPRLDLGAGEVAVFNINRPGSLHHQLHARRPDAVGHRLAACEFPETGGASGVTPWRNRSSTCARSPPFFVAGLTATASPAFAAARAIVNSQQDFKVGAHPTIIVDSSAGGVELRAGGAGSIHVDMERKAESEDEARKLAVEIKQDGNTIRIASSRSIATAAGTTGARSNFKITRARRREASRSRPAAAAWRRAASPAASRSRPAAAASTSTAPRARCACARAAAASKCATSTAPSTSRRAAARCASRARSRGTNRVETGGGSIHVAVPADDKLAVDASTGGGSAHNDFGLASRRRAPLGPLPRQHRRRLGRLARDPHRRRLDPPRQVVAARAR